MLALALPTAFIPAVGAVAHPESATSDGGVQVVHRVNAGGEQVAVSDVSWGVDSETQPSPHVEFSANRVETAASPVKGSTVPAEVPTEVFESLRWLSGSTSGYLRYVLPRDAGDHQIRLFFVERAHTAPGGRLFHVDIDGQRVLTDYDIYADAGAANTGVMREWSKSYTSAGDTVVELFASSADAPVISGIEVLAGASDTTEPAPEPAPSGSRLGLHVTGEELAIWRDRWASGTGDAFLDARVAEEKTRITNNKNEFMANPSGHLWGFSTVYTGSDGCVDHTQGADGLGSGESRTARVLSARVRDAAWWGLVHQDATVLNAVKNVLAAQPDQQNVNNFAAATPWCPLGTAARNAAAPHFAVTHATVTALFAYDYVNIAAQLGIVAGFTSTQKTKIDTWHKAWAYNVQQSMDDQAGLPFVNRLADDYRLNSAYADPANVWTSWRYSPDGPSIHRGQNIWHNRRASNTRQVALVGLMLNDEFLKGRAHRWLRDWFRYHVYPNGATADIHRGASQANTGTHYMALGASHVLTSVDAFARAGDTSLYDYAPTEGMHDTAGAPHHGATGGKNFLFVVQTMARYGNNTFARYNANNQRFDLRTPANLGLHDRLIPANIYYQDTGLSRDFYRGTNGQPPWSTPPGTTGLNDAWSFPAPYLMWAGLEGQVWPYPTN